MDEAERILWDHISAGAHMPNVDRMLEFLSKNGIDSGVNSNYDNDVFENPWRAQNKEEVLCSEYLHIQDWLELIGVLEGLRHDYEQGDPCQQIKNRLTLR